MKELSNSTNVSNLLFEDLNSTKKNYGVTTVDNIIENRFTFHKMI